VRYEVFRRCLAPEDVESIQLHTIECHVHAGLGQEQVIALNPKNLKSMGALVNFLYNLANEFALVQIHFVNENFHLKERTRFFLLETL